MHYGAMGASRDFVSGLRRTVDGRVECRGARGDVRDEYSVRGAVHALGVEMRGAGETGSAVEGHAEGPVEKGCSG